MSFRGANTVPFSSFAKSTSPSVPSLNLTQILYPSKCSASIMCGHFIILGVELVIVVRAVRQANPAAFADSLRMSAGL